MSYSVNLLAWRAQRRRRGVRQWALLFSGLWLVALMLLVSGLQSRHQRQAEQLIHTKSDSNLLQALTQRNNQLNVENQRWQVLRQHEERREETRRWQDILQKVAAQMPAQAWFSTVQWRGEVLSIAGQALHFSALAELEQAARALPEFSSVTAGSMQRNERGHWQFSYQLRTGGDHGESR
ncbi:hypothetical protein EGM70_17225 [Enterobacteriaceae bacterium 89]|nr:hypothetical protein [Enterobacteriaceae bacterium 89]